MLSRIAESARLALESSLALRNVTANRSAAASATNVHPFAVSKRAITVLSWTTEYNRMSVDRIQTIPATTNTRTTRSATRRSVAGSGKGHFDIRERSARDSGKH